MNTKSLTGGRAFALGNFKQAQKKVGRQAQQAQRQVQQAKKIVQRTSQGRGAGSERELWLPNAQRPPWLDGTLPGDRGFDPFQLSRPVDYAQFDLDSEGSDRFKKGELAGDYRAPDRYTATSIIAPWNDAIRLDRLRENEIINGRWAMLAVAGILAGELATGVPWHEAGKYQLDNGPTYLGQPLPFTISQTVVVEVIGVGLAETFRSQAEDVEDRIYPGGIFDPLKLTEGRTADRDEYDLRLSEVLHGRLAMTAFAGLSLQAMWRGTGAFASIDQSQVDAAGAGVI